VTNLRQTYYTKVLYWSETNEKPVLSILSRHGTVSEMEMEVWPPTRCGTVLRDTIIQDDLSLGREAMTMTTNKAKAKEQFEKTGKKRSYRQVGRIFGNQKTCENKREYY